MDGLWEAILMLLPDKASDLMDFFFGISKRKQYKSVLVNQMETKQGLILYCKYKQILLFLMNVCAVQCSSINRDQCEVVLDFQLICKYKGEQIYESDQDLPTIKNITFPKFGHGVIILSEQNFPNLENIYIVEPLISTAEICNHIYTGSAVRVNICVEKTQSNTEGVTVDEGLSGVSGSENSKKNKEKTNKSNDGQLPIKKPGVKDKYETEKEEEETNKINDDSHLFAPAEQLREPILAQPGLLVAIIGAAVVGLLCIALLVMFIVYRMRKDDEGSYPLDEQKYQNYSYAKAPDKEFYA